MPAWRGSRLPLALLASVLGLTSLLGCGSRARLGHRPDIAIPAPGAQAPLPARSAVVEPGSLDASFGEAGMVIGFPGTSGESHLAAVAVDGKILVGGHSRRGSVSSPVVARLTARGELDTTFGGGRGAVLLPRAAGELQLYDLHALADGAIVGTGFARADLQDPATFALLRLTESGAPDRSAWPEDSTRSLQPGSGHCALGGSTLDPEGRILLAGYLTRGTRQADVVVARFWP